MTKTKLALIALASIAGTTFAAETVSSANIVGYVKTDIVGGQYNLIGINFGDDSQTLADAIGTDQLTANADFTLADQVFMFNTDTLSYEKYALKTDEQFYPCNTVMEWYTASATNPVVPIGSAMWVVPAAATGTNELVLSGDVNIAATSTVSVTTGYQMMSYPFSCDITLGEMSTEGLTANADFTMADQVAIWNGSSYTKYGLKNDGLWYPCNTVMEWYTSSPASDQKVAMGGGYWLISQGVTTYIVPSPYFNNL